MNIRSITFKLLDNIFVNIRFKQINRQIVKVNVKASKLSRGDFYTFGEILSALYGACGDGPKEAHINKIHITKYI